MVSHDITAYKQAEIALEASEKRFRNLFEDSPVALWEEDFSKVKQVIDGLMESDKIELRAYLDENPQELGKLLRKIKIIDVNKAVLDITGAQSKGELFENLPNLATDREMEVWREQFIALSEGSDQFQNRIEP